MKRLRYRYAPILVMLVLVCGSAARGQPSKDPPKSAEPAAEKWLLDRALTVTAQPEPRAALQYRLYPRFGDLKDGNAVPIYLRLNFEQNDAARRDWFETPKKWNALPIDKIPLAEAKAFLDGHKNFLRQFELGARRKRAEWDYTLDQGNIIDVLLPDVQTMRSYVPMMLLQIRVALAEGNFAAAAHGLETGFSFSRHVANGPFLINRLVGIACASQCLDCVLDFVERPGAPNLYWSLVALPRPLIDLRGALELEQQVFELQFPELADLDRPRSAEQWDALLKNVRTDFQRLVASDRESKEERWKPVPGTGPNDAAAKSPDLDAARKRLIDHGNQTAEQVATMPPAQVLLLDLVDQYHKFRDDTFKAGYLPFLDAPKAFAAAETRRKAAPDTEGRRFADVLLPAVGKVMAAQTRLDRKVAALRVIEALRLYAAAHDGKLPETLAEISQVPVPVDPGTGKPFAYQREGDTATVIGRLPGEELATSGLRYRITMKQR